MKKNGIVLYEGPSLLDGKPIVVIATGIKKASSDAKTGAMIQTWILRSDVSPTEAVKTGQDCSICGNCPHRGEKDGKGRSCYVNVGQAPLAVWSTYKRGGYLKPPAFWPWLLHRVTEGRMVRLGAYGDPAAVPVKIWHALIAKAKGWTGYTHQWRNPMAYDLRYFCMASVDTEAERMVAFRHGWRSFRVRGAEEALGASAATSWARAEIACPASNEGGNRTTCEKCGLCAGLAKWNAKDIAIVVHGSKAKIDAYVKRAV